MILPSIPQKYRTSLVVSLCFASFLCVLTSVTMDGGISLNILARSVPAYAALVLLVILRRPATPTRLDLILVRWGLVIIFVLSVFVLPPLWHWMSLH